MSGRVRHLAAAAAFALVAAAGAETRGGSSAGEFLRLPAGAREAAMGDAQTAGAEGLSALQHNPAGLAWAARGEVGASYQALTLDVGRGAAGLALPWGERSGWGAGLSYLDYGRTTRTTISTAGGAVTASAGGAFGIGYDLAAGVSYGRRIGEAWAWGVTARGISSRLDDASASAVAADVGLAWRPSGAPYRLGAVVRNIGTRLRYDRTSEGLPLLVRVGGSCALLGDRVVLHADVEAARNERPAALVGVEARVIDALSLRAGYDGRIESDDGLTVGLGVRHGALAIDYAYVPFGALGETHRVDLRYLFGGGTKAASPEGE